MPTTSGTAPQRRQRVCHSSSHSPPNIVSPKPQGGKTGSVATAPGALATAWASAISAFSAYSATHQKGAPNPTESNSNASASIGMITKVVSGIATTLASAPYNPAL